MKRENLKKYIAIIVAVLLALGIASPLVAYLVYGAPADSTLNEMKEQEKAAISQVQELERQLNEASNNVYEIELSLAEMDEELKRIEEEIAVAEQQEKEQKEKFDARITALCEYGSTSYIDLLFSADGFADFLDRLVIVREFAEYDKEVMDAMEAVKEKLYQGKLEAEAIRQEQLVQKEALDSAVSELETKVVDATAYMNQLQQDRAAYEAYLEEKARAEQEAKNRAGITSSGKAANVGKVGSGSLMWPTTSSYITSHFSPNRVNPVTGVNRPHTGTDIGAGQGEPVWASRSGTVALAEFNGGYGNCVIINHGNGISTLYAHMSAILVSPGESVTQGQQIGRVGSTGNSTGPHLHFEVLIDGSAVDPMQFF